MSMTPSLEAGIFTPSDLRQLAAAGITPEKALQQLAFFKKMVKPDLLRPCTLGDGIATLPSDTSELEEEFLKASAEGSLIHFIPASGAATRMGLGDIPKALVPFHRYGSRTATPMEEHIREAAALAPGTEPRLHFTLAPEHESVFRRHVDETLKQLRAEGIRAEVTCSTQDPKTQTLAFDVLDETLIRDAAGKLLLRPGGHGALLLNLENCGAEFAWIRNVDNIAVEPHRAKDRKVHRALAGSLIRAARERGPDDKPLRICGMVPNTGEPGGGPFWVEGEEIRIVESFEVGGSSGQTEIFRSATHFNPVDMICALRDSAGKPYSLADFSDPNACVITRKTFEGRQLLALEWPGLWNGGMAGWDTICVEIPLSLFTPVKTAEDLLRPEHQW